MSNLLKNTAVIWDSANWELLLIRNSKALAHQMAIEVLERLADRLNLSLCGHCRSKDEYEIRSNPGGIAVSGEVTLHTDPLVAGGHGVYVQICQWSHAGHTIMWRTCFDRTDYTGNINRWAGLSTHLSCEGDLRSFARCILEAATRNKVDA